MKTKRSRRRLLGAVALLVASGASTAAGCAAPPLRLTPLTPPTPPPPTGLRPLADKIQLRFGSAVSRALFESPHRRSLLDIFARDFNMATIHSGFYWPAWEPAQGHINASVVDEMKRQIDALHGVGINDLRGHPLVFPTFEPQWLTDQLFGGKLSKAQASELLVNHVRAVIERFKGLIGEWVVVNEPFRFYGADRGDLWKIVIGEDYVEMAFRAAREADPGARLLLNDYDNHARSGRGVYSSEQDPINRNKMLIERLRAKGLIDGIGLQMHIRADKPPKHDDLIETMRSYGVPVHITELDVNLKDVPGTDEARFALQAQVYADVLDAALRSGVCNSVCLWEFGDKYSWLEDPYFDFASPRADGTPYDDDLQPKPAYHAMKRVLLNSPVRR